MCAAVGDLGLVAFGGRCQSVGGCRWCGHQRLSHFSRVLAIWAMPTGRADTGVVDSPEWPHLGQAWKWSSPGISTSLVGATVLLQPQAGQLKSCGCGRTGIELLRQILLQYGTALLVQIAEFFPRMKPLIVDLILEINTANIGAIFIN